MFMLNLPFVKIVQCKPMNTSFKARQPKKAYLGSHASNPKGVESK